MEVSAAGLELIKQSEGFRAYAYQDVAGVWTIGYGHRLTAGESFPAGVTDEQATALLEADVAAAEVAVTALVKVPLKQGQFDALVDFTFNLGAERLQASTLLKELNAGQYDSAGLQLLAWDHAGGQVSQGLERRREAELALWQQA